MKTTLAVLGMAAAAALVTPSTAQAGGVEVGIRIPAPVVVRPAPVVVRPARVVVNPVVVRPVKVVRPVVVRPVCAPRRVVVWR